MRCLTCSLRLETGVMRFIGQQKYLLDVLAVIHALKDQEVIANGCKSIRICLREDKVRYHCSIHKLACSI